jgi:hypothetical protein
MTKFRRALRASSPTAASRDHRAAQSFAPKQIELTVPAVKHELP